MALTVQQLQGMLDQLDTAIAVGATRVSYATGSVEYRSLSEMIQIRDRLAAQIGQLQGQSANTTRRTVAGFSNGLC